MDAWYAPEKLGFLVSLMAYAYNWRIKEIYVSIGESLWNKIMYNIIMYNKIMYNIIMYNNTIMIFLHCINNLNSHLQDWLKRAHCFQGCCTANIQKEKSNVSSEVRASERNVVHVSLWRRTFVWNVIDLAFRISHFGIAQ